MQNGICFIGRNEFINNTYGINAFQTPFLLVKENEIDFENVGLINTHSGWSYIYDQNNFTGPGLGTMFYNVDRASVYENTFTSSNGIFAAVTNARIFDNFLTVGDSDENYRYGIYMNRNTGSVVKDNIINLTEGAFGIQSNSSTRSRIHNNEVYSFDTDGACIQLSASNDEEVFENITTATTDGHGLRLINATDNLLECKLLEAEESALRISTGSDLQQILSNEMEGSEEDLITFSELGIQRHHGNFFDGGTVVANLGFEEIFGSRFFVDDVEDPRYLPSTIVGNDWFINEDDQGSTVECLGTPGISSYYWIDYPNLLCDYLNLLDKLEKDGNFKAYFIRYFHLIKSMFKKVPKIDWPVCFKQKMRSLAICGMQELVKTELLLESYVRPLESTNNRNMNTRTVCL